MGEELSAGAPRRRRVRWRPVAIGVVTVLLVAGVASGGYALNRKHRVEQQRADLAAAGPATDRGDCATVKARLDAVAAGPLVELRQQVAKARQPCLDWAATEKSAAAAKPADAVMAYAVYLQKAPPDGLADRARAAATKAFSATTKPKAMTAELCRQRNYLETFKIARVTGHDAKSQAFLRACVPAEIDDNWSYAWLDYVRLYAMKPRPAHLDGLLQVVGRGWVRNLNIYSSETAKLRPYRSVPGLHGQARLRLQYLGREHFSVLYVSQKKTARIDAKPCTTCRKIKTKSDGRAECDSNSSVHKQVVTLPAGTYYALRLNETAALPDSRERWNIKSGKEYWYCFW